MEDMIHKRNDTLNPFHNLKFGWTVFFVIIIFSTANSCYLNKDLSDDLTWNTSTLNGQHYYARLIHNISLTSLKDGFQLRWGGYDTDDLEMTSLPMEQGVLCYLFKDKEVIKTIRSLNDLKGYVTVSTKKQAIEYARLITSGATYFMFRPEVMIELCDENTADANEIIWGKCQGSFFNRHKIKNLECIKKDKYFEIQRYVNICDWSDEMKLDNRTSSIAKLVEGIYPDGQYIIEKKYIILEWKGFNSPDGISPCPFILY